MYKEAVSTKLLYIILILHIRFQLKLWSWHNANMKTTVTLRKALDIESNRCTNGFSFTLN